MRRNEVFCLWLENYLRFGSGYILESAESVQTELTDGGGYEYDTKWLIYNGIRFMGNNSVFVH